jgi:RHS repeat-associated protein
MDGAGGRKYLTADHLGSTRVVTDSNQVVRSRRDYEPFGEEVGSSYGGRSAVGGYGGSDATRQRFTSKERDNESGLDYFGARYYSSAQGRFISADEPFAGQYESDPQTWNLYQYARNNPLVYVDPTGKDYDLYDKDGKLLGRVKDASELDKLGYKYTGSMDNGNILNFEGGYTATYVEGDPGSPVQALDDSGMTPLARGVFTELDRSAAASIKLINIAADITLTPISIISGTALFRGGITTLTIAQAGASTSIRIGRGLAHVLDRHAVGGAKTAGKSVFNAGEDIVGLIRQAETVSPVQQVGGNFQRVVNAGRIIGVDRVTGQPTSTYTVITNAVGDLVTAFPGKP